MKKNHCYEKDQEPVSRKIREVNGSGGFCLPCFFRDRDFDKFEMQTVNTTRKGKEPTSVWTKTRILIAYNLICKCYICSSEVSRTLKIMPEGWIGISRLRIQHADYGASTPLILSANVPYVIQNIFHKLPKPLMLATPYLSGLTRPKKLYMAANFAFLVVTI